MIISLLLKNTWRDCAKKKASRKVNALVSVSSLIRFELTKRVLNSSIASHLSYSPLVCMFHGWRLNNRINHIHEPDVKVIYKDCNSSFTELLRQDNSLTIHQRNLKLLVREMFKVKIGVAPDIMKEIFEIDNRNKNFRHDFLINDKKFDQHITELKQLFLLAQKFEILYLMASNLKRILKVGFLKRVPANYAKLIFNVKVSLNNKFPRLCFLWQNSVKLAIKAWIWLLHLCVINLPTHLVHRHITFDPE